MKGISVLFSVRNSSKCLYPNPNKVGIALGIIPQKVETLVAIHWSFDCRYSIPEPNQ